MSAGVMHWPAVSFREGVFAWSTTPEDEARYRRIQSVILALLVILCLMVLFVPVPKDRPKQQAVPPRIVKRSMRAVSPATRPAPSTSGHDRSPSSGSRCPRRWWT